MPSTPTFDKILVVLSVFILHPFRVFLQFLVRLPLLLPSLPPAFLILTSNNRFRIGMTSIAERLADHLAGIGIEAHDPVRLT